MLHLIKLAVGAASPDDIARHQRHRSEQLGVHGGRPFFRTRNFPRRAEEILGGGSIYWVVAGALLCRQQIHDIVEDRREDGTPCTGVLLEPAIVAVMPRAVRPFQGWRYLPHGDAPADLLANGAGGDELPLSLRRELLSLCLL